jgi:flavodoxin
VNVPLSDAFAFVEPGQAIDRIVGLIRATRAQWLACQRPLRAAPSAAYRRLMGKGALLICVSVSHGNTAAVARAMASVLDADVREPEQVDLGSLDAYDVVGFGSGIFAGTHHPRLRGFIEQLPRGNHPKAFVFTTAGLGRAQSRPWQRSLESELRSRGFEVVGSFACRGFDTWLPLRLIGGINRGHPDAHDLTRAREFAAGIARQLSIV